MNGFSILFDGLKGAYVSQLFDNRKVADLFLSCLQFGHASEVGAQKNCLYDLLDCFFLEERLLIGADSTPKCNRFISC